MSDKRRLKNRILARIEHLETARTSLIARLNKMTTPEQINTEEFGKLEERIESIDDEIDDLEDQLSDLESSSSEDDDGAAPAAEGSGLFDIKLDYNNVSKKTLSSYGNLPVTGMEVRRHPIPSMISSTLRYVTGNKVPFDKLYHLSIIATVTGAKVIIEKNEVVNISANFSTATDDEHLTIPMKGQFTISEMLEKTRKRVGNEKFFDYSAFGNNCQNFVKMNLESVDMYTSQASKFVYQDLTELIKHTPVFAQKLANATTYVASLFNKLTGGKQQDRAKHLADSLIEFCHKHNLTPNEAFDDWFKTLDPRICKMIA